jgi:hypothetical protein
MMTPTEEHYEKLLAEVNRESERYNGMHQIAVMEIERLREALLTSTTMMEALLVQLESWGHASAVNARGQLWRNEEVLARLPDTSGIREGKS